ncbi:hypothetical protein INT45_005502 [Circinella minor]|uniref:Uncharacterized protein n=1 Tax=Circinella minor TaxID=1195481 RepID=A0A8H7RV10_9FUNG|nr:hypothetical protein INT45_005502 [Circinella minor]
MAEDTFQRLTNSLLAELQRQMNTGTAITTTTSTTASNNQANTERLSQLVATERRKKTIRRPHQKRPGQKTKYLTINKTAIIQIINHNNSLDEDECEAEYNNIEGLANRIISTLTKSYSQDESTKVYPDYWANLDDNKKQNAIDDLNAIVRQKYNIPFDECEVDWCSNHMLMERWNNRYKHWIKTHTVSTQDDPESLPTSSIDNPINESVSNLASSTNNIINESVSNLASSTTNTINESDESNPTFLSPRETIAAVPETVPSSSLSDRTNLSVAFPNNPAITTSQPANISTTLGSSNGGRGRGRGRGSKRATRLVESITAHQDTINAQQKRAKRAKRTKN